MTLLSHLGLIHQSIWVILLCSPAHSKLVLCPLLVLSELDNLVSDLLSTDRDNHIIRLLI